MNYHSDKETIMHNEPESDLPPTHEQIQARALELWHARGCPEGSADQDWLQAEADLKREAEVHAPLKGVAKATGAVQG